MAHVKASATTKGNKDSVSKRLGVKVYGGQRAMPGNVIVRQRGTKVYPGDGVSMGRDHTIFAIQKGSVLFAIKRGRQFVSVLPFQPKEKSARKKTLPMSS